MISSESGSGWARVRLVFSYETQVSWYVIGGCLLSIGGRD